MDIRESGDRVAGAPAVWQESASRLIQTGIAVAEWFLPPAMRLDEEAHNRALLFVISHLLGPCLGLVTVAYLFSVDPRAGYVLWVPAMAIGAFWGFPIGLKHSMPFLPLALASIQNLTAIVLFLSIFYGGASSPFLPWLITVPVLVFLYLGGDRAIRRLAVSVLGCELWAFYILQALAGGFESRVPIQNLSGVGVLSTFLAALYVTVLASYYGQVVDSQSELRRKLHLRDQNAVALREAKEAAEAGDRAKSMFLTTMSHELRTPLNAVIGFAEIMQKELFGPLGHANYKTYVNDIHSSGARLLATINDILDISRAGSGDLTLADKLIDCDEVFLALRTDFMERIEKAGLYLQFAVPNRLPQLRADPRMVKKIISNLLGNAIKFTPAGGRITITASASPQNGLAISVEDTGIGISANDLKHITKPFVQADSSLQRRHEGAGLGLSLVDMIMKHHGGSLTLESEEGCGTTARVQFPAERLVWPSSGASKADPLASTVELYVSRKRGAAPRSFNRPRILIVEDDCNLRDLFVRMLERAGFATYAAANGREALRLLLKQDVDLVITDMVMPEMDGAELIRTLRSGNSPLPVIAFSGADDFSEYNSIAVHLGAHVALSKPVSNAELVRAVNDVLAEYKRPASAAPDRRPRRRRRKA